jgi:23S rRNA (pseudouridine1915-N3)-methyltransferase
MKIALWSIGKGNDALVKDGVEEYTKRLSRYYPVEWNIIPVPKNAGLLPPAALKKKEAELILQSLKPDDYLVALDEKGKELNSAGLSAFLEQRAGESIRQVVFLIGGAYGIEEEILKKAKFRWSLSQLTFPHQLVRLILAEQLYRACTISHNEKYHHK